ncbi:MAG: sensor histidine kinase [Vicinamibacterales bacterium]
MSSSLTVALLLPVSAVAVIIGVALVRDRLRALEAAFAGVRLDLAARDDALRVSDRSRRQLLVDVSYELKTPLTAMRGYVETLHMSDLDLDDVTRERYFQTIERETVRLDRIVEDLLDLARLESGVSPLHARLFAVERVFQHVMLRHEHETRARGIEVDASVGSAADQVVADPDRIEQVVESLFANALCNTAAGGHIELCAEGDGDAIVLSVVDSGQGIDPDHVPFVFDRFYKADPSRRRNAPGSGLGLSIARAIVERHHGSIAVTSAPGRTAFIVVLPHQSAEPSHQSTSTNL